MSYIKRLVMHGFKSFPRKTEIPFSRGINVILGPNGSGKSNVSDAICFALGRLSIKSMRAAKASNLIFLGTKEISPAKEASVEVVFDNSEKTFSKDSPEVSIKRIVRRNGQSLYKINNETKTRQDVLSLLAQAGIDPQGFNMILQGEIQNFVRMQPDERRGVMEEVSGISVYESRKEKSLRELEKTDERLKEISSVLRERTAYLNNLENERQQALRFKKLEADIKKFKASIIHSDLQKKNKESEKILSDMEKGNTELRKIKETTVKIEIEIENFRQKINQINSDIQKSTGLEQEKLNNEIANLRAELAGITIKIENYESKISNISTKKSEYLESIKEFESSVKELQKESPGMAGKKKEMDSKKEKLEKIEEQRKRFYMVKSEVSSVRERIQDKENLARNYTSESDILIRQIESLSLEIFDQRASHEKLNKLKSSLAEKREALGKMLKREIELEKTNSIGESEIESQNKILERISKMDTCPICQNKITPKHMDEIKREMSPKIESLKKEIENADKELRAVYQHKEILNKDIEQITESISKAESDLSKISAVNEKKSQIKTLHEKSEESQKEILELQKRRRALEKVIEENSNIEEKYETLNMEVQEVSMRSRETIKSEVAFKQRELDRLNIALKQLSREEKDAQEELSSLRKLRDEREKSLSLNRKEEEQLTAKFKIMISGRDTFYVEIRKREDSIALKQREFHDVESGVNNLRVEKARVDAEMENLGIEMSEAGVPENELVSGSKESLAQRLVKAQEIISRIGSVNLRSLEVYDSIKKEYDSIKERAETISKEKESIMSIIHEIDIKKKKAFIETLKKINELFSRNFSQLSIKGEVYLDLENRQDPFEAGVNIVVKVGHGKYFDVRSLSGGEQTLVALSLIFAIQEYRPYYFYLLDEIDAALDKRNSERLAQLLDKYMQNGQYIVVSHNDEVISKATNLYGVSMHDGISKIISLKV
ncbi:MAG: chromosome segregation protein SMC [Nanoarchaeota archaeon]|nr:chromosome segregation protein SMC [Nanoarchaeota archaeon]MBU2459141.1 chromosome segregation protein SMC [Nanoarchaeota archaeon]